MKIVSGDRAQKTEPIDTKEPMVTNIQTKVRSVHKVTEIMPQNVVLAITFERLIQIASK